MTSTIESKPISRPESNEPDTDWSTLGAMLADPQSSETAKTGANQAVEINEAITSPRERAGSRIGNWLRRLAEKADSTSEHIAEEKDLIRENLISFGQTAKGLAGEVRDTVISAGAATIQGGKEVALTTAGLGIMGAEAMANALADQYTKGEEFGYAATTSALEFGRDKVSQTREWLQQKRDAALARKAARHAKWSARFNAVKNAAAEIVDTTKDTVIGAAETVVDAGRSALDRTKDTVTGAVERTRETVHVARAVGAAALEGAQRAGRDAYTTHTDQNRLY